MKGMKSDFISQMINETFQADCHMRQFEQLVFHENLKCYSLKNKSNKTVQFPMNWLFFNDLFRSNSEFRIDKNNHKHLYDILLSFLKVNCTAFIFRSIAQDRIVLYISGVKNEIKKAA